MNATCFQSRLLFFMTSCKSFSGFFPTSMTWHPVLFWSLAAKDWATASSLEVNRMTLWNKTEGSLWAMLYMTGQFTQFCSDSWWKKKKPTSTCFSCSMWIADVFLVLLDRALIPSAKHAETLQNSRRTTLPGYPYLIEEAQIKWEKGVDSWLKADWEVLLTWEPSVLQQASRCLHLCPHWTPAASHSRSTYRPREVKMQGWEKYAVTWMKDGVVSCTGTWGTVLPHYLQLSRLNEIFCGEVKRAILTQLSGPVLTPRPVGWVQIYSLSFFIS